MIHQITKDKIVNFTLIGDETKKINYTQLTFLIRVKIVILAYNYDQRDY